MPTTTRTNSPQRIAPPSPAVTIVGALMAVWCGAFAAINVSFEITNKFASGSHAAEADALSVANWYVVVVKLVGVAAAVLAVTKAPGFLRPSVVGTLLWAAFATVGIYVVGSIAQVVTMLIGGADAVERLGPAAAGYVFAFLLAAAGFWVLAASYAKRAGLGRREVVLGLSGGPLILGSILVVLPAVLRAVGVLSSG
jgi:hypothetical protein